MKSIESLLCAKPFSAGWEGAPETGRLQHMHLQQDDITRPAGACLVGWEGVAVDSAHPSCLSPGLRPLTCKFRVSTGQPL